MEREHGFSTREGWFHAFEKYFNEIKVMNMVSYRLSKHKGPFEVWMTQYRGQSHVIQSMFKSKNRFMKQHIQYFMIHPEEFNDEIRTALIDYLFRYCMRIEDTEAVYMVLEMLMERAEREHDEISIMKCCYIFVILYSFLDVHNFADVCLDYLARGIHLFEKHYNELDEETKSIGLSFYDERCIVLNDTILEYHEVQDHFDNALIDSLKGGLSVIEKFIKTADMTSEVNLPVPYIVANMISSFLIATFSIPSEKFTSEQIAYIIELTQQAYEKIDTSPSTTTQNCIKALFLLMSRRFQSDFDEEIAFKKIEAIIQEIPTTNVSDDDVYDNDMLDLLDAVRFAFQSLSYSKRISEKRKNELGVKILDKIIKLIALFPNDKYMQHIADEATYRDVIPLVRYLANEEEMIDTVLSLTIYRQFQTAIHTKMVAHISVVITKNLLERNPAYFLHTHGYETIEEVIIHKEEIIEHMRRGAMLHDVGKILCTNIVNMQYRKIIDMEYETIKFHPTTSGKIMMEIPLLSKYHDIAVGHHKSFDGTFGYPENFDNVHSPEKKFIDIVTIADSLDAATDPFGRNYAKTKTFMEIMKELNDTKGTRYSDAVVDFILHDYYTYEELNRLVTVDRVDVNREVHTVLQHNIIKE